VEEGPTTAVFDRLAHPYTQGLFAARPRLGVGAGQRLATIPGTVPELADIPGGCPFRDRCIHAIADCAAAMPPLRDLGGGHGARCIRIDELSAAVR